MKKDDEEDDEDKNKKKKDSRLLIFDCEFSGPIITKHALVSIAAVLYNIEKNCIERSFSVNIKMEENLQWDENTVKEFWFSSPDLKKKYFSIKNRKGVEKEYEAIRGFVKFIINCFKDYETKSNSITMGSNRLDIDCSWINYYLCKNGFMPLHLILWPKKLLRLIDTNSYHQGCSWITHDDVKQFENDNQKNFNCNEAAFKNFNIEERPSCKYTHDPLDDATHIAEAHATLLNTISAKKQEYFEKLSQPTYFTHDKNNIIHHNEKPNLSSSIPLVSSLSYNLINPYYLYYPNNQSVSSFIPYNVAFSLYNNNNPQFPYTLKNDKEIETQNLSSSSSSTNSSISSYNHQVSSHFLHHQQHQHQHQQQQQQLPTFQFFPLLPKLTVHSSPSPSISSSSSSSSKTYNYNNNNKNKLETDNENKKKSRNTNYTVSRHQLKNEKRDHLIESNNTNSNNRYFSSKKMNSQIKNNSEYSIRHTEKDNNNNVLTFKPFATVAKNNNNNNSSSFSLQKHKPNTSYSTRKTKFTSFKD